MSARNLPLAFVRALAAERDILALDGSGFLPPGDRFPAGFVRAGDSPELLVSLAAGAACAGRRAVACGPARALATAVYALFGQAGGALPPLKLAGAGPDGGQPVPLSLLSGMTVLCPADGLQAAAAAQVLLSAPGPVFLYLSGQPAADVTLPGQAFEAGPAESLRDGRSLCILSSGSMTAEALRAADRLLGQGVFAAVVHLPTLCPLDEDAVRRWVGRSGRALCCEPRGLAGLGDSVRRALWNQPSAVDVLDAGSGDDAGHPDADRIFLRAMDLLGW